MKRAPISLFTRSALLIAALIITSQLLSAALFMYLVQRPRLYMMVDLAESHLYSVRTAIALLPESQRRLYLKQMSQINGLQLQAHAPILAEGDISDSWVVSKFLTLIGQKLPAKERVFYQATPDQAIWVQIEVGDKPYWVRFSIAAFSTDLSKHWLDFASVMVVLAALGGWVMHRTLNRPLQQLSAAVNQIGAGQRIEPLQEQGPKEIVAFIHALNRMNADLKQMEADRTLMLAGISHDLRTPITRIQLALELIGGDFDAGLKNRVLANLAEIEGGLKQCLDFACDAEDEPLQRADLNDLARQCAANYAENGYSVGLDLCEEAEALVRPFAIERLVKNLLDNAIKYANKDIRIATARQGQQLYLSVLDRGAGIADADIAALRRPFARAEASRGGSVGYGLGLAIVDNIAAAHQATIDFIHREGGGLEVRVTFAGLELDSSA